MAIDVDALCPITPGLLQVAEHRADAIVKSWARLHAIWGTGGLNGPGGDRIEQAPTLRHLALSCYMQGVRDASAVAATMGASDAEA